MSNFNVNGYIYPDVFFDRQYVDHPDHFDKEDDLLEDRGVFRAIINSASLKSDPFGVDLIDDYLGNGETIAIVVPTAEGAALRFDKEDTLLHVGFKRNWVYIGYKEALEAIDCQNIVSVTKLFAR